MFKVSKVYTAVIIPRSIIVIFLSLNIFLSALMNELINILLKIADESSTLNLFFTILHLYFIQMT